jgi:hypothetical protein
MNYGDQDEPVKKGGFYNEKTLPDGDPLYQPLSNRVRVLGGAAVGSLATGAGYEINAKRQMDNLESDYRNERISRREYESRKDKSSRVPLFIRGIGFVLLDGRTIN